MIKINSKQPIAVLGATGFIGRHAVGALAASGMVPIAIVRKNKPDLACPVRVVPDFRDEPRLHEALKDCGTIIHLADESGRFGAGQPKPPIAASLRRAVAGLQPRIIFASSIYARLDEEGQTNFYGAMKREQERILLDCPRSIGLRLPPVYGPGAGGSFSLLQRAAAKGVPLPFGRATAQRSYLSVSNLMSLMIALVFASHQQWERGSPGLYEPEDSKRISTKELARDLATIQGKTARILPVPRPVLDFAARVAGRPGLVSGAFDELAARDNAALLENFNWRPEGGFPETLSYLAPPSAAS